MRNFWFKYDNLAYYGYDLCENTIREAKRKQILKEKTIGRKINACFDVKNILTDEEIYEIDATNVFWYASMCMFPEEDRKRIISNISKALKEKKGIFSGSADVKLKNEYQWDKYIGLYKNEIELKNELSEYFLHVFILPRDTNGSTIFFMASDGELPFYNKCD